MQFPAYVETAPRSPSQGLAGGAGTVSTIYIGECRFHCLGLLTLHFYMLITTYITCVSKLASGNFHFLETVEISSGNFLKLSRNFRKFPEVPESSKRKSRVAIRFPRGQRAQPRAPACKCSAVMGLAMGAIIYLATASPYATGKSATLHLTLFVDAEPGLELEPQTK